MSMRKHAPNNIQNILSIPHQPQIPIIHKRPHATHIHPPKLKSKQLQNLQIIQLYIQNHKPPNQHQITHSIQERRNTTTQIHITQTKRPQ
mmetsp:Transcript_20117/g.22771  ORF Transcript_20117/g.22771 Transcript_20117/m.22771 type:complete len:90 (-) Transcript_20117:318-587(-)